LRHCKTNKSEGRVVLIFVAKKRRNSHMAATEAIARVVDDDKDQSFRCLLKDNYLPSSLAYWTLFFGIIYLIDLDTKIKSRLDLKESH
jgi:hypothetical protein